MREIVIGRNVVRIWDDAQHLRTYFPDDTSVPASPQDHDTYRLRAQDLGYGTDTWQMCLDHELAHTWLAVTNGQPWSWVLFDQAHGSHHLPDDDGALEEARVLAWQRDLDKTLPRPWDEPRHPTFGG